MFWHSLVTEGKTAIKTTRKGLNMMKFCRHQRFLKTLPSFWPPDLENCANTEDLIEMVKLYCFKEYEQKERQSLMMRQQSAGVYLNVIDTLWMEHIDNMQHLLEWRGSAWLRPAGSID